MLWVRCVGMVGCMVGFGALLLGCGSGSGGSSSRTGVVAPPSSNSPGSQANAQGGVKGTVVRDDTPFATDPTIAYGLTLTMTSFHVPAGAEVYKCQDFANPFGGDAVELRAWKINMSAGSHHMTLFNLPGAVDGSLVNCLEGGLMAGQYSFSSQKQTAESSFPDGIGEAIPAGMGFTMDAHYINAGTTDLQATVAVSMGVGRPGVVQQHAGAIQLVLLSIEVPPTTQPIAVGGTCTMPQDMNVLGVTPHMHYRGSHFVATTGTTTLLTTEEWEDPPSGVFLPALPLKAGDQVSWSCNYTNETDSALTYGGSAVNNVMCNMVMLFYPVLDLNNPLLTCAQ